ncbi:MAG: hypothetical protein HRU08_01115 [Oleispira sp.]|nr:hypothetical protein [Oleispira sp.]
MKNIKIMLITGIVITLSCIFFKQKNITEAIVKPEMNRDLEVLLNRNAIAYQQVSLINNNAMVFKKTLPKSLEGIDLSIALPLDEKGNLIVGMVLKDFFEIYLSAMGEEGLRDILLRIQNALALQLSSPALEQGYAALKRFIDYKVELENLAQQQPDANLSELDNIRQQKEILIAIQQEYFSPQEIESLFAVEAEYDAFMLEHLTIQQNENLTPAEKQRQIEALAVSLPEDVRLGRERVMAPAKIYQQAQQMTTAGHSAEDIYQMRARSLGEETASALAQLDQERGRWQQRLDAFNSQYQSIMTAGMGEQDQRAEVRALLARNFNASESIRVRALVGIN